MTSSEKTDSRSLFSRWGEIVTDPRFLVLVMSLVAFLLRVWRLDEIPPGWRDDELINSLVISQKVLDGDWALYYPDASGHEALFHILTAATLSLFGPGAAGIRLLPAILGTLTIPLTYVVGVRLFGKKVGLLAAAALTISFWSLMYSRIGIRHISTPVFMLAAFYFFLRAMDIRHGDGRFVESSVDIPPRPNLKWFLLAGIFVGIGFYTYFASRGVPLILGAFLVYLLIFQRWRLKGQWPGLLLMAGAVLLAALPLLIVLAQRPEAEARVSELAVPLSNALNGDLELLTEHVGRTFRMFFDDGDDEWLYNIPYRPIFSGLAAALFWVGVFVAFWHTAKPLARFLYRLVKGKPRPFKGNSQLEAASAFLLIWWLVGISPGFISVPAASLGHSILAQSAAYILLALPFLPIEKLGSHFIRSHPGAPNGGSILAAAVGLILLLSLVLRDLPDYYQSWPQRGMVRFLYRADIQEIADYLSENPEITDIGISGLLAGPWDKLALDIDLAADSEARPRWFNSDRVAILSLSGLPAVNLTGYPIDESPYDSYYSPVDVRTVGGYTLSKIDAASPETGDRICFTNGLCSLNAAYNGDANTLDLIWEVDGSFISPKIPLISNPPPLGIYSGPRLLVFAHLLDDLGLLLSGDDGLWVDVTTLLPGDQFIQQHRLENPGNGATLIFGLYDPMTGERIGTLDGRDHLQINIMNPS